jgi:hypothetical protein
MRTPAIIQNGWWVALAAVAVSLVTAWIVIAPLSSRPSAEISEPGFDLSRATVPRDLVVQGMAKDGVHVLSDPSTLTPAEIDRRNEEDRGKLLVPDDRVIGVVFGGEARAYPLRLMRWHEVVNDVVGGEPIAITYSPLCDSVVVFSRKLGDEIVELGVSGYLFNSNTVLYDQRLHPAATPLWLQLDGEIIAEPDPGFASPLSARVAALDTWGEWRERHPETRVLAPQPDLKKLYKRDPYHSYFGSDLLHFPVRPLPPPGPRHLKDRMVIVTVGETHSAFALRDLARSAGSDAGTAEIDVAGMPIRIRFAVEPGTAVVEPLTEENQLRAVRHTFWFAWYSLGGMIPDRDEFLTSDCTKKPQIPSPGGA